MTFERWSYDCFMKFLLLFTVNTLHFLFTVVDYTPDRRVSPAGGGAAGGGRGPQAAGTHLHPGNPQQAPAPSDRQRRRLP